MKSISLNGEVRASVGKKDAKNLRKEELVPCVLYGGEAPVHFSVSQKEMKRITHTPEVFQIDLNLSGTTHKAILKDTQFQSVTDELLHADFLMISEDKPVEVRIPSKVVGTSKGVLAGGKLQTKLRALRVKGIPSKLPEHITVDITNVELGGSVKVREISVDGIELLDSPNAVVAAVRLTRGAIQAAKEAAKEAAEAEA